MRHYEDRDLLPTVEASFNIRPTSVPQRPPPLRSPAARIPCDRAHRRALRRLVSNPRQGEPIGGGAERPPKTGKAGRQGRAVLLGIRYYSGKAAKGSSKSKAYGGLFYTGKSSVDLFNAWKAKSGTSDEARYYQVIMDTNYDDEIDDPFNSGRSIYNRRAIVWSMGQDGQEARGRENDEKNRDNVYSWTN